MNILRLRSVILVFCYCIVSVGTGRAEVSVTEPFAHCEELIAKRPDDHASVRCFERVAWNEGLHKEATRSLEARLGSQPDNPWLRFYLANLGWPSRSPEVVTYYRDAMRLFANLGDNDSQIKTLLNMAHYLDAMNQVEESGEAIAQALDLSEFTTNAEVLMRVRVHWARHLVQKGEDLREAYLLLRMIESEAEDSKWTLYRQWLTQIRRASYALAYYEEAEDYARRLLREARERGEVYTEAAAAYSVALARVAGALPSDWERGEALRLTEESLAAAVKADNPSAELGSHRMLGLIKGGEEGREHLRECVDIASETREVDWEILCSSGLAGEFATVDPEKAQRWLRRASKLVPKSKDPLARLYDRIERQRALWALSSRSEAIEESRMVLESIATLRELQESPTGRADLMADRSWHFYWLSGRILESAEPELSEEDLKLAFSLVERFRARVLLEFLAAARAAPERPTAAPLLQELTDLLNRKAQLQRTWFESSQEAVETDVKLEALYFEEEELRQRVEEEHPSYALLHPAFFAVPAQVEANLAPNEAMLSFQIALWEDMYHQFGGGAWLLVSTRSGTRRYRLPDRVVLEPAIDELRLLESPESQAPELLTFFYNKLLRNALQDLPVEVTRLVIIPDGQLHLVPFGALRPEESADSALINRYRISLAPSATFWLRQPRTQPPAVGRPALVLADPVLNANKGGTASETRDGRLSERAATLGPLPHARREGRWILRHLGDKTLLRLGKAASESFLKNADLQSFGVLHLAVHAVADLRAPQRSAVFLTPGDDLEDGWLQPSEIIALDLRGRLVMLAACDTASGQVLQGEGTMSLARAFFQAGARTVVGSLWPLRDHEAALLSSAFYRHLGEGQSVDEALASAQRERLAEGASMKDWAGLVVLGDGSLTPFPGGLSKTTSRWQIWLTALGVLAAILFVIFVARLRHRTSEF